MKKVFALLIVVIVCLSFTACSGSYTTSDGTKGKAANGEIVEDITCEMTITRIETISGHSANSGMKVYYLFTVKNDDYVAVFHGSEKDYALLEVGNVIELHYTLTSDIGNHNGYKQLYYLGESKTLEYFGLNEAE